jgi:UDP-3-O-[3-hydroxymyristoyl] glucosamine N-acyltransferase
VRLADLGAIPALETVRDGEFDALGGLSDDAPRMLVSLYDARFLIRELLPNPHIACVITSRALAAAVPSRLGLALADDPKAAFYAIHEHLRTTTEFYGVDSESSVSPEARVSPAAWIAPRNVRIGRGSVIEPGARILERSIVGEHVVIRSGSVIGAEGFETKEVGGAVRLIAHAGGVRLHDRVEVQANGVVCRAVFNGFTEIGEDTKLGNQVGIAHNVRIGRRCRIAAGAQVTGSVRVGDDVWIGPNATISNRVRIGDRARVSLGAVVVWQVETGATVTGNFAVDHRTFLAGWRRARR